MMTINEIVELLMKARQPYYGGDTPIMTDAEYDALENMLKQMDPDHPFFETIGSHQLSKLWKSAAHKIFMGSLEKDHEEADIRKWASKFNEKFMLQYKLDGLSVSLNYQDSMFINGITRGEDGVVGEDIGENIRLMRGFQNYIPEFTGSLRAEIIMDKDSLERINKVIPEEKNGYSNPRNAASGISRRLDGVFCRYLQLIFYDITENIDEHLKIAKIDSFGLITPYCYIGDIDGIVQEFNNLKQIRESLPYDIDGVVIKVDSIEAQKRYGVINNRPRAQRAWKFEAPQAVTTIISCDWDVGRTGIVTPVANIEPVEIAGSIIRKSTLHNIAEIKRLGIGCGDLVMLEKRGDIIPKISKVIKHVGLDLEIPERCPSCGSTVTNDGTVLRCENDFCPKKNLNRIRNWIKVTKIESLGDSLTDVLNLSGKLNGISDLYRLQRTDISLLEGWGNSSADKIIDNINKTRQLSPEIFLAGIGIPSISDKTSKELLKNFGSIEELFTKTVEDIKKIKGFSDISATTIVDGLKKYKEEINDLLIYIKLITEVNKGRLYGLSFCFTGSMAHPRAHYETTVKDLGGDICSSVTKDLSYLVCNENKGSSKSLKAEKYGVKVITEEEFFKLIN